MHTHRRLRTHKVASENLSFPQGHAHEKKAFQKRDLAESSAIRLRPLLKPSVHSIRRAISWRHHDVMISMSPWRRHRPCWQSAHALTIGREMAGENGGWEICRSGKEAPKALDASLGECTPKVYRALPLQYKTANINVKNFRVYIQV